MCPPLWKLVPPTRPDRKLSSTSPTPEDLLARVHDRVGATLLVAGDRTVVTWDPVEVVTDGDRWPDTGRRLAAGSGDDDGDFAGGVVGYVGYEAGFRTEAVPPGRPTPEPEVWLCRTEGAAVYRHAERRWRLLGSPSFRARAARLLSGAVPLGPAPAAPTPTRVTTTDADTWQMRVRRILAWIAEGDCYQVDLTRPVVLEGAGDPFAAWRRLHHLANAPHGAYLAAPGAVVLSASPELLLDARGPAVASLPIKGTRPRNPDPVVDHALAGELRRSEKDRAELVMIVDLVRNDLGRVAVAGSVRCDARRVTAHANVHHASRRVDAVLRDGLDAWDALAALFPPGSVVGAPKVRAAERIRDLEGTPRGVYCGTIGWTSGSRATWSVAIRTAVWTPPHGGTVRYHVGGGIVADSDPAAEWRETVHKGTAMARAFAGTPEPEALAVTPRDRDVALSATGPRADRA